MTTLTPPILCYRLLDSANEPKPALVSEASARNWLDRRSAAYAKAGSVVHWLSDDRFVVTVQGDTVSDVSIQEVGA